MDQRNAISSNCCRLNGCRDRGRCRNDDNFLYGGLRIRYCHCNGKLFAGADQRDSDRLYRVYYDADRLYWRRRMDHSWCSRNGGLFFRGGDRSFGRHSNDIVYFWRHMQLICHCNGKWVPGCRCHHRSRWYVCGGNDHTDRCDSKRRRSLEQQQYSRGHG